MYAIQHNVNTISTFIRYRTLVSNLSLFCVRVRMGSISKTCGTWRTYASFDSTWKGFLWPGVSYNILCIYLVFGYCFVFFFFLHSGMFSFFVSLRLCSSHLVLTASTYFIVRVISACCVICTLPQLRILLFFIRFFFFFLAFISRVAFFVVVLSYTVR